MIHATRLNYDHHLGETDGLDTISAKPGRGSIELLLSGDRKETALRRRIEGGGFPSNPSSFITEKTNEHL